MKDTIWVGDYGVPTFVLGLPTPEKAGWLVEPMCQRLIYGTTVHTAQMGRALGLSDLEIDAVEAYVREEYADQLV